MPAMGEIAGEQAWRFRHALVRDAAYESTPKSARAHGHERVASWLAIIETRVPEADARIGTHLERAHGAAVELGRARRSWKRSPPAPPGTSPRPAAARTVRGDLPSEIAFLSRAAALLGRDDPARAELLPAMASALFEAGSLDRAAEVADRRWPSASASAWHASAGEPPSSASACTCFAIPRPWSRMPRWRSPAAR